MTNLEEPASQDSAPGADKKNKLVEKCQAQIHRRLGRELPELAFVLGSGFQDVLGGFRILREAGYRDLPGFPRAGVAGHSGTLLLAELEGMRCLVCSGRAHYYEGHAMEAVMFPVRMLANCGVKELILTNAAGGINRGYAPGDFMLAADHINFTGVNPLRGMALPEVSPFVDLTRAYASALRKELQLAAVRARVKVHSGVYLGVSGPSYETPAEIRAFRKLGADAVGMSTIPEVLMARALGLKVAVLSCITNPAAGLRRKELSHEEVLETGRRTAAAALRLLAFFARKRVRTSPSAIQARRERKNLKINRPPVGSNLNKR